MENEDVLSGLLRKRVEVVNQHAKAQRPRPTGS
jgi:hypothetical protein